MAQHIRVQLKFDPTIVMYLVIPEKYMSKYAKVLEVKPTERFFEMIRQNVMAYVGKGKEPPKAIAGAIMNIADDMVAGREVSIRAGDYIDLMSYARTQKML